MNNFNPMLGNNIPSRNQFPTYLNSIPANNTASTNNLIWVQGIEGAKAWQLNPNSMVVLLDSEAEGKMYIKVSDNIGMSSLRIFNYVEEIPSSASKQPTDEHLDLSQFVKRDELEILIKELLQKNEQTISATTTTTSGNAGSTTGAVKIITPAKK